MAGTTEQARVSIVVACHNAEAFIRESVESALLQSVSPLEVVVVDDASTDASSEIVQSIPEARLISIAKGGVSRARNEGMLSASGEFVLFHDADDRLLPTALESGLRAFDLHPECGFVYGFARQIDGAGTGILMDPPEPVANAGYGTLLAGPALAPPSTMLFRKAAIEHVGGFDSELEPVEDVDLYLRVARSFPIHCHGEIVTEYRRHGDNVSARSPSRTLRKILETYDRHARVIDGDPGLAASLDEGRRYFGRLFGESVAVEMFESVRAGEARQAGSILMLALRQAPRGIVAASADYARRFGARAKARVG